MKSEMDIVLTGKWVDFFNDMKKTYTVAIVKGEVELEVEVYENWTSDCYYIVMIEESMEQKGEMITTSYAQHFFDVEKACQKAEVLTKQKIEWEKL